MLEEDQAIHKAARAGHTDVVRVLAEAGADVNSPGNIGMTPLCQSAFSGQLTTARFLMDLGAEMNTQDDDGATALHHATQNNHLSLVCELLDRHADKTIQTRGLTPLALARQLNHHDIALVLDDSEISDGEKSIRVFILQTLNFDSEISPEDRGYISS